MTFNLSEFLTENLIKGYLDGSFSEAQVNIFAMNYLMMGRITEECMERIANVLKPPEEEPEK